MGCPKNLQAASDGCSRGLAQTSSINSHFVVELKCVKNATIEARQGAISFLGYLRIGFWYFALYGRLWASTGML
jgi:hypothetical protein